MKVLRHTAALAILLAATASAMGQVQSPVGYEVPSPRWAAPAITDAYCDRDTASLSPEVPMLQWTVPVSNNSPFPISFTYDLKIVETMPGQDPIEAIERNPVAYSLRQLMAPQCLLPVSVVRTFSPDGVYVAQVTARAQYVRLQNGGRSDLLLFRVNDTK